MLLYLCNLRVINRFDLKDKPYAGASGCERQSLWLGGDGTKPVDKARLKPVSSATETS